jgi:hypothetical protein
MRLRTRRTKPYVSFDHDQLGPDNSVRAEEVSATGIVVLTAYSNVGRCVCVINLTHMAKQVT